MTAARGERLLWPDVARGACIVLVVLWHAGTKHVSRTPWLADVAPAWQALNLLLQPVRVPLFFVVSGYLAAGAVRRPWPSLLRTRVRRDLWVHAVWVVLLSAFFAVGPPLVTRFARSAGELLLALAVNYTGTWYVYALAVYVVVAKAAAGLPLRTVVGGSLVLALLADTPLVPSTGSLYALPGNLVFFVVPALRPDLVDRLVARGRLLPVAAGYLALAAPAVLLGVSREAVVSTTLSVLGASAGLLLAARLCAAAPAGVAPLAALGSRTLPVYVLHLPLLAVLHAAVPPLRPLAPVYPAVAVALLVAGTLLLHRLLLACRLGVLFRLPERTPVPSGS